MVDRFNEYNNIEGVRNEKPETINYNPYNGV